MTEPLPPLSMEFDIDDKGQLKVSKLSGSISKLGRNIQSTTTRSNQLNTGMDKLYRRLQLVRTVALSVGSALGGIGLSLALGKSISDLAEFETSVIDMSKVTNRSLDDIVQDVLNINSEFGSSQELIEAYYQAVSAGAKDTSTAIDLIENSSKTAIAAHIEQGNAIKVLTKLMNGFNGEIATVQEASDLLFATEAEGQTTVAELAGVIGGLAASAHSLNISQFEMAGSLAQITQTAGSTEKAATRLQAIYTGLVKPSEDLILVMNELGFATTDALIAQRGFTGALKDIFEVAGTGNDVLAQLFGREEAIGGLLAIMSSNFSTVEEKIKSIENTTGITDVVFKKFLETLSGQWATIRNEIDKTVLTLTLLTKPYLSDVLSETKDMVISIRQWVQANHEIIGSGIVSFVEKFKDGIGFLVDHWDDLIFAVKVFIGYKLATTMVKIASGAVAAAKAIRAVGVASLFVSGANPWLAIAAGLVIAERALDSYATKSKNFGNFMFDLILEFEKFFIHVEQGWILVGLSGEAALLQIKKGAAQLFDFQFRKLRALNDWYNAFARAIGAEELAFTIGFNREEIDKEIDIVNDKIKSIPDTLRKKFLELKSFNETAKRIFSEIFDNINTNDGGFEVLEKDIEKAKSLINELANNIEEIPDIDIDTNLNLSGNTVGSGENGLNRLKANAKRASEEDNLARRVREQSEDLLRNIIYSSLSPMERYKNLQSDVAKALDTVSVSMKEQKTIAAALRNEYVVAMEDMLNASDKFAIGATRALRAYAKEAKNSALAGETVFLDSFQSLEDETTNLLTNLSFNYQKLFNDVFESLNRQWVRKFVTGPLAETFIGGNLEFTSQRKNQSLSQGQASGLVGIFQNMFQGLKSMFGFGTGGIMDFSTGKPLSNISHNITNVYNSTYNQIPGFAMGGIVQNDRTPVTIQKSFYNSRTSSYATGGIHDFSSSSVANSAFNKVYNSNPITRINTQSIQNQTDLRNTVAYQTGGIHQFSEGFVSDGPTLLIGEGNYRREAVVPLPDGRSIPVSIQDGGQPSPNITNINNVQNINVPVLNQWQPTLKEENSRLAIQIQRSLV